MITLRPMSGKLIQRMARPNQHRLDCFFTDSLPSIKVFMPYHRHVCLRGARFFIFSSLNERLLRLPFPLMLVSHKAALKTLILLVEVV